MACEAKLLGYTLGDINLIVTHTNRTRHISPLLTETMSQVAQSILQLAL